MGEFSRRQLRQRSRDRLVGQRVRVERTCRDHVRPDRVPTPRRSADLEPPEQVGRGPVTQVLTHARVIMIRIILPLLCVVGLTATAAEPLFPDKLDVKIPDLASDNSVTIDYDIVYVRAGRAGDEVHKRFYTDFSQPVTMEPGADLMLLHPDGKEELLVPGGKGSVTDPMVSFDGKWVYYSFLYDLRKHNQWSPPKAGADIFKINLESRKIVRLTNQQFLPNTGMAEWSHDYRDGKDHKTHFRYGVFNMGPCPLPVANAIYDATGVRLRRVPFRDERVLAELEAAGV